MKNKVILVLKIVLETFAFWAFWFVAIEGAAACIENIIIQEDVRDFIESAEYEKTEGLYHYYAVYTDEIVEETITYDHLGNPNLGATGDIFYAAKSYMDVAPFTAEFLGFYFGGHAGIIGYDESRKVNQLVEALGGSPDENYVDLTRTSDILKVDDRNYVGLRVKAPIQDRQKAWDYALTRVGKPYNYLFIINTKERYYCTDLVARCYGKEAGMNYKIEWNGFATSTQDIHLSNDTYISFVKIKIGKEYHIYYLKTRTES